MGTYYSWAWVFNEILMIVSGDTEIVKAFICSQRKWLGGDVV